MKTQLKVIAAALAGAFCTSAFADLVLYDKDGATFSLTPKVDVGVQVKKTESGNSTSLTTADTEKVGDGGYATSRLTLKATKDLGNETQGYVTLDLRFGSIVEGQTGISNNDIKVVGVRNNWGLIQIGDQNHAPAMFIYEKPHPDVEIVKYGVSMTRDTTLTNRSIHFETKPLFAGIGFLGSYAFGDQSSKNTKFGDGNQISYAVQGQWNIGATGKLGAGLGGWNKRASVTSPSGTTTATNDDMRAQEHYLYYKPNPDIKIGLMLNKFDGHLGAANKPYSERAWNLTTKWDVTEKWRVLGGVSRLYDRGSSDGTTTTATGLGKNDGRGLQLGLVYKWAKGVEVYSGYQKTRFDKNETITNGKFNGNQPNFLASATKQNEDFYRVGIMMEW